MHGDAGKSATNALPPPSPRKHDSIHDAILLLKQMDIDLKTEKNKQDKTLQ